MVPQVDSEMLVLSWEHFADVGAYFVIAGVAGEGLELLIKLFGWRFEKLRQWSKRYEPLIDFVAFLFLMMVVGGLWMEVRGSHNASAIRTGQLKATTKQAAEAIERAAVLNRQVAAINQSDPLSLTPHLISAEMGLVIIPNAGKWDQSARRTPCHVTLDLGTIASPGRPRINIQLIADEASTGDGFWYVAHFTTQKEPFKNPIAVFTTGRDLAESIERARITFEQWPSTNKFLSTADEFAVIRINGRDAKRFDFPLGNIKDGEGGVLTTNGIAMYVR